MRVKTMLEVSLDDNSKTVYLGGSKVNEQCVESIYIQVLDATDLTSLAITGATAKGASSVALGAISMADFSKVTSITASGIYMVATDELYSLTITATGEVDLIIKSVE